MTPYILSLALKLYKYMLKKINCVWSLGPVLCYVPTTYNHHNPVTVPGPQCCDHLLGGRALYTLYTLYRLYSVQWSAACAG